MLPCKQQGVAPSSKPRRAGFCRAGAAVTEVPVGVQGASGPCSYSYDLVLGRLHPLGFSRGIQCDASAGALKI